MKQNLISLLALLLAASVGAWLNLQRTSVQDLQGCRSNLKNLATALEMYSSDNGGRYPLRLEKLVGPYLRQLPTCPTTGLDYRETYRCVTNPDSFSFGCAGRNHGQPKSQAAPWYDADDGLVCHD